MDRKGKNFKKNSHILFDNTSLCNILISVKSPSLHECFDLTTYLYIFRSTWSWQELDWKETARYNCLCPKSTLHDKFVGRFLKLSRQTHQAKFCINSRFFNFLGWTFFKTFQRIWANSVCKIEFLSEIKILALQHWELKESNFHFTLFLHF